MEGKAALFKRFANIDAWPICLASQDADEIVRAVEMIAPGLRRHQPRGHRGAPLLRDRGPAAGQPRHPGLPRRPARHGDRGARRAHQRAARACTRSSPTSGSWSPAAARPARAIVTLLLAAGVTDVVVVDRAGALCVGRRLAVRRRTASSPPAPTRAGSSGDLQTVLTGADVFIGVSAPGVLKPEWIQEMADDAVVFALANPDPEVDPAEAEKYAAVVASGRSDYPNQINNVLAFPGVFRGLLDARASEITTDMLLRAAEAIALVVKDEELNPNFIIPTRLPPRRPQGRGRRHLAAGPPTDRRGRGLSSDQGVRTRSTGSPSSQTSSRSW